MCCGRNIRFLGKGTCASCDDCCRFCSRYITVGHGCVKGRGIGVCFCPLFQAFRR